MTILKLILSILLCQAAGAIGAIFTTRAIPTWYTTLVKPSFNPPGWVFGPVWFTLFTMMGIAFFLIWRSGFGQPASRVALVLFLIQLALNAFWSVAFFGWHSPASGLIVIVVLWAFIVATTAVFWRVNGTSAIMMLPYLLWVTFAGVLNYTIWNLNRGI